MWRGMRLYALEPEAYPAMIPGEGRVHGFVLDYKDVEAALPHLDALEGCDLSPPLYHRALVKVYPTGETVWGPTSTRGGRGWRLPA